MQYDHIYLPMVPATPKCGVVCVCVCVMREGGGIKYNYQYYTYRCWFRLLPRMAFGVSCGVCVCEGRGWSRIDVIVV